jgi:hypothetical protein
MITLNQTLFDQALQTHDYDGKANSLSCCSLTCTHPQTNSTRIEELSSTLWVLLLSSTTIEVTLILHVITRNHGVLVVQLVLEHSKNPAEEVQRPFTYDGESWSPLDLATQRKPTSVRSRVLI